MTHTDLTPEEFADELDLTFEDTEMIVGMEIAEYTDEDGETLYTIVFPDGNVDSETLSEVWGDGNLTMGLTRHGSMEVMLDDENGVNTNW